MADFLGIGAQALPDFTNLGNSVGGIVDAVVGDFLANLTGTDTYRNLYSQDEAEFKQYGEDAADRRNWHMVSRDTSRKDYYFLLVYNGSIREVPFNINPRQETVSEPHGTVTTFTQGGGKIIQSEGMVSKDISISGTCGLYPGERRTRLPDSGIGSGFEAFKNLQNVFRRYCYLRRFGDITQGLKLVYVNRRRQESWVVEPKIFTSEDSVDHNNMFTYQIQLETLYPYRGAGTKGLAEGLLDAIPGWRLFDSVAQRVGELVDVVNASAGKISAIVNGFALTILPRITAIANTLADVKAGRLPNVANLKRDTFKDVIRELAATASALEAAGETELAKKVMELEREVTAVLLNDKLYEFGPDNKARKLTSTQNKQLQNFTDSRGVSIAPEDALAAGNVTERPDISQMFGGNQTKPNALPGTASYRQNAADLESNFVQTRATVGGAALDPSGKYQIIRNSFDSQDAVALPPSTREYESQINWDASWNQAVANIDPSNSDYKTAKVNNEDSIQTLSFRLLGDPGRWLELVLLNNLKYPYLADQSYISANSLSNVIAYGGDVIFATPKVQSSSGVRVWRNETSQSLSLNAYERSLGSDILVDRNTNDVVWGANDLALSYGVDNIEQFIRKRVVTRKNSLRRSLRLGISNFVGTSVGAQEAIIKAEAKDLFFGDERIVSCEVQQIIENNGRLIISYLVLAKNRQDPFIITEPLEM